jgi:hypothetical protein
MRVTELTNRSHITKKTLLRANCGVAAMLEPITYKISTLRALRFSRLALHPEKAFFSTNRNRHSRFCERIAALLRCSQKRFSSPRFTQFPFQHLRRRPDAHPRAAINPSVYRIPIYRRAATRDRQNVRFTLSQ